MKRHRTNIIKRIMIGQIEKMFNRNDKKYLKEEYQPSIEIVRDRYNKVLAKTQELIFYMGLKTPLEISYLYNYLLHNGYLSATGNIEVDMESLDIPGLEGAQVLTGKCCCRQTSIMLKNILEMKNQESYILGAYSEIVGSNRIQKTIGNHIQTLVVQNKKAYVIDSLNNKTLLYKEPGYIEDIQSKKKRKIKKISTAIYSGTYTAANIENICDNVSSKALKNIELSKKRVAKKIKANEALLIHYKNSIQISSEIIAEEIANLRTSYQQEIKRVR